MVFRSYPWPSLEGHIVPRVGVSIFLIQVMIAVLLDLFLVIDEDERFKLYDRYW
jgi:hypothetical protein